MKVDFDGAKGIKPSLEDGNLKLWYQMATTTKFPKIKLSSLLCFTCHLIVAFGWISILRNNK